MVALLTASEVSGTWSCCSWEEGKQLRNVQSSYSGWPRRIEAPHLKNSHLASAELIKWKCGEQLAMRLAPLFPPGKMGLCMKKETSVFQPEQ